jgi:tetratricopeptide (TPR) repeat protein
MIFDARRWGRGVTLAAVTLPLALTAGATALAQALARSNPNFALRLDSGNSIANAEAFDRTMTGGKLKREQLVNWAARGRRALLEMPLSTAMVRLASLDPELPPARSTALLATGERLSRRDALTQLALIEAAVQTGRVDLALAHYDRALSIYPDMREVLFPVLAGALAVSDVRSGIANLARRRRPWMEPFIAFAIQQPDAAAPMAKLLTRVDRDPSAWPLARQYEGVLASAQANRGEYAAALRLARRASEPHVAVWDQLDFSPSAWAEQLRPLAWASGNAEGVSSDLQSDGTVIVTVGAGASGRALTRILVPAPGRYRLVARVDIETEVPGAPGHWTLACLTAGGHSSSPLSTLAIDPTLPTGTETTLNVPAGCAAVRIEFIIDNSANSGDAALILRSISLTHIA